MQPLDFVELKPYKGFITVRLVTVRICRINYGNWVLPGVVIHYPWITKKALLGIGGAKQQVS